MTKAVSIINLLITNQNEALAFYTEKLGFEIRTDVTKGDFRWLTVGLPDQPDLEFVLLEVKPGGDLTAAEAETITTLLRAGKLSQGGVIQTDAIDAVYGELSAKGVEFVRPPTPRGWGTTDAEFRDNSGNTWLLLQQDTQG
jgi:uncharacterized glyoxalase superfamily protein PhnB